MGCLIHGLRVGSNEEDALADKNAEHNESTEQRNLAMEQAHVNRVCYGG
jgi:hypothetical protein